MVGWLQWEEIKGLNLEAFITRIFLFEVIFYITCISILPLLAVKLFFHLPTAVQKGRISTTQSDVSCLQMGLGDMRNPQSFYSNYITLLLRADTIARYQQSLGISTNIAGLESASELATRLLVSMTEWAKNIPFFSELTLPDQSILLRSCWSELFILNAAQHCSPFHMAQPLTINALTSPSNTEMLTTGSNGPITAFDSAENLRLFEEQVEKLKNLHIDSAEFCCLKAILLFNPGKWSNRLCFGNKTVVLKGSRTAFLRENFL